MDRYHLTKKAVDDLGLIWEYTFDQCPEQQADRYYGQLIESCEQIASDPNLGKEYGGIITTLRGLKTNRHIIFYRQISPNEVEIIRVFHERMDLKNRISE